MDTSPKNPEHVWTPRESLKVITESDSEKGLTKRLVTEINETEWDNETLDQVTYALGIALEAHQHDKRGKHPYSTHLLRVTVRIMSPNHFTIRDQPNLIIAAALHDIVEDHPDFLISDSATESEAENQTLAINAIEEQFGSDVSRLVAEVTNPVLPDEVKDLKALDEVDYKIAKNELYRSHVIELIGSGSEGAIIKLSDFVDNCVGLGHNEDAKKATKLAHKYFPLIDHFRNYIETTSHYNETVKARLLVQMDNAERRCNMLIDATSSHQETDQQPPNEDGETHSDFDQSSFLAS